MFTKYLKFAVGALFIITIPLLIGALAVTNGPFWAALINHPPHPYWGMGAALIAGYIIVVYVYVSQNSPRRKTVSRYAKAEYTMIESKHMSKESLIEYHTNIDWRTYASLSFSTLFIVVSFIVQNGVDPQLSMEEDMIYFVSVLLLASSAICLTAADMVHTNSLSPIVPLKKRFQLINLVVVLGGVAFIMQGAAVQIFLSLMNTWISIFGAALGLVLNFIVIKSRSFTLAALAEEFGVDDDEMRLLKFD